MFVQSILPRERRNIIDAQRRVVRERAGELLRLRFAVERARNGAERDARALRRLPGERAPQRVAILVAVSVIARVEVVPDSVARVIHPRQRARAAWSPSGNVTPLSTFEKIVPTIGEQRVPFAYSLADLG